MPLFAYSVNTEVSGKGQGAETTKKNRNHCLKYDFVCAHVCMFRRGTNTARLKFFSNLYSSFRRGIPLLLRQFPPSASNSEGGDVAIVMRD